MSRQEAGDPICPVCDASTVRHAFRKGGWDVLRCRSCGVMYVGRPPSPSELEELYGEAYFRGWEGAVGTVDFVADRRTYERQGRERAAYVGRLFGSEAGRLLDIGCGMGFFLGAMRATGWNVTGVDVSEYAVRYARETLGLDVRRGDVGTCWAELGERPWDVVTAWDVLEHVADPRAMIERYAHLVRTGGLLVLSTTCVDSPWVRLLGGRARIWNVPAHLYGFSGESLRRMLAAGGMRVVSWQSETVPVSWERLLRRLWPWPMPRRMAAWGWLKRELDFRPRDCVRLAARKEGGDGE